MTRMTVFGFWGLIFLAGTALCLPVIPFVMEGSYRQGISSEEIQTDNINLEDYSQIDPAPKSTVTISRPIEHGTPLIPYIPGPTLLYHPKHGGFDSPPSPT